MKLFNKNENNKKIEKENINTDGWDCITKACEKVYPTQKDPKHYAPMIKWKFGG